ncbi:arginine--tRNA ligase [Fluviispira multicolorata]|uniref:Arginine--tRNA ligase n=1 Tax=Fluviispira multicolorata TaxID=2654512 RepID=A0A833N3F0_9BACT|nr:arginine--tRNA ligase [Fluviispira multicolorata]KAB8033788.1 arginine--tRNA ligase [Fluviispira multicolorata]
MATLHDPFKSEIAHIVCAQLKKTAQELGLDVQITEKDIYNQLTVPPDFSLGQAALPCFLFAKSFKKAPNKIAQELAQSLNSQENKLVDKIECVNAYLNFHCQFKKLAESFSNSLKSGEYFKRDLLEENEKDKIVVEYSQPNTHKAMHVGHLRCLVLGDSVSNLLEYAGNGVVRATYPGDVGTHVAKIIWYLTHPTKKELPKENQCRWLGQMYAEADEAFKQTKGKEEEVEVKEHISEILRQLNNTSGEYYELWKETREWSLNELKDIYKWLNSHFDIWYFESECEAPSKLLVKRKFEEGFFIKDNGAIGIDLSQWKLGFAMFLKSDGNGLYLTKDLDLITRKFSDPKVTKSIVVVDSRQKLHFQQLFKTAELMGYPQAVKSVHLSYETVNTEDGKPFSSRQLNGLQLVDLRLKMEEKVKTDYLERYRGQWSNEEIELTAKNITIGALKYGMLRVDNNTQINFSLEEWLKLDGETGPYLQYVHARCSSILEKLGSAKENINFVINENAEKELLFILSRFNDFALQAAQQNRPSILTGYLYDTAKSFNRFYEQCPIKNAEENIKETRLTLVENTKKVISEGLSLLGIPAPQKM